MMSNDKRNPNKVIGSLPKLYLREQSFIEPIVKNPFSYRLEIKSIDKLKIGFNAIFLLPIRLICCVFFISSSIILSFIITCGTKKDKFTNEPLKGWRKKLRTPIIFFGKCLRFCCGFHHVKVNGKKATKEEATIFAVAPHTSFFDLFLMFEIGFPCCVSKAENADIPFFGRLVRCIQPILVTREDSKNRSTVVEEIRKRADPKSEWPQILIFPEGTCTNSTCLITYKPGAFLPGLPVQPILIKYNNKFNCTVWTWDGDTSVVKIIFYTLCQFKNNMEITFLPVYNPSEDEKAKISLYAYNVRQIMAKELNIPVTNHTFEDVRLMLLAKKYNFPLETGLVEFSKIKDKLGLNFENCQSVLEKFVKIAKKSTGKIDLQQFADYLELPAEGPVKEVFKLYDRDSNGQIEFREFLLGLTILTQPANNEETLKIAFELFDENGKGHISLKDLQNILNSSFSMSHSDVNKFFEKIDKNKDGVITFDEFKSYASEKPEYARIFISYHELKNRKKDSDDENDQLFVSYDVERKINNNNINKQKIQPNKMVTVTKRTTENTDSTTVNLNKLNIEEKKVN